ncbi:hypothetical protein ACFWIW_14075 [Amycolatopsis sp. NPDC058340]|uniref:hypothetical protein n=1 Tax=Amycolatopsis sp. NPDC058340 TaxID=3346453 RepID=UPI00365F34A6
MPRYSPEDAALLALAAHEVGHAVACQAAGLRVAEVRLLPDRGWVTHKAADPGDQDQVDGELVTLLAGREAGARWAQKHHGMWRGDALRWSRGCSASDLALFRRAKRTASVSPSRLESRARSLVARQWGRIDRLSRQLADSGRLPVGQFN